MIKLKLTLSTSKEKQIAFTFFSILLKEVPSELFID